MDPEQRTERTSVRGMGGWTLTKINNRPFRATNMPVPLPPNQTPLPISPKNTLQTGGREFYGKRGPQDGAICIYSLEYINWWEFRAICHILALNQLPWNILASLNIIYARYGICAPVRCWRARLATNRLPETWGRTTKYQHENGLRAKSIE